MGKIVDGKVKGTIAGNAYREMDGEQIVQSKPGAGKTNMSPVTMGFATRFGVASSLALHIRESFQKSINGFYDSKMINNLNKEIDSIIKDSRDINTKKAVFTEHSFNRLSGFDFNTVSPLREQIGFLIQTDFEAGELRVSLPRIQIPSQLKFPPKSNRCELTLSLILIRPLEGYRLQYPERRSVFASKEQTVIEDAEFTFSIPPGCLYILTMGLRYTFLRGNMESLINHKKFNPVCIMEAFMSPGSYSDDDELEWIDMPYVTIN